jgi:hypothetical protein
MRAAEVAAEISMLKREKRLAELERLRLEKTVSHLRAYMRQQGPPETS